MSCEVAEEKKRQLVWPTKDIPLDHSSRSRPQEVIKMTTGSA